MTETRTGRYWRAPRFGWYVNVDIQPDNSWITMEMYGDYWRPTERLARRKARKLEA